MAFQKKYFVEYRTLKQNSDLHVLELWQNTTDVLVAEEVKGAQSPFIIEMPELSHKFQVVRGTGASISLLSDTDMKFFAGLEHIDPMEFKVIHYVNGVLNWIGYLNADMQSEPYDIDFNYLISTTANDGFSLLDRYRFLQSEETKYVGLKSEWELLQICLNKLALAYTDIRVKLATTFTGFSGDADKTILHESFINCANFYDEDGEAMTLREVLESIFAPYGAFICQSGGSIYISDIHTMAGGGTIVFQKFNSSTYAYVSTVNFVAQLDVSSIGYFGTGHSIERSGGTNMQKVVYSPYPDKDLIDEKIVAPDEFDDSSMAFADKDGYKYRTLIGHNFWEAIAPSSFEESCKDLVAYSRGESSVYITMPQENSTSPMMKILYPSLLFKSLFSAAYITYSNNYGTIKQYYTGVSILVTGKMLLKTVPNPYSPQNAGKTGFQVSFLMRIGTLYYNQNLNGIGGWESTPTINNYLTVTNNGQQIENQWLDIGENGRGILIKINTDVEGQLLFGEIDFQIWSVVNVKFAGTPYLQANLNFQPRFEEVWLKNLKLSIVGLNGEEISDTDVEYFGKLNKLLKEEGEEITLTTGSQMRFADRGAIIRSDGDGYAALYDWTRAGETYRIEELLLNSLCSNYRMNYLTLLGMNLKNEFGIMNVITDSTYLGSKKFMVKSANIDFAEYRNTVNLVEISQDVLDIVKES